MMTKHKYNLYDDELAAINNYLQVKFKVRKKKKQGKVISEKNKQ